MEKKIFEKYVFDLATIGMMTDDTEFYLSASSTNVVVTLLYNLGECTKQLSKILRKPEFSSILCDISLCNTICTYVYLLQQQH